MAAALDLLAKSTLLPIDLGGHEGVLRSLSGKEERDRGHTAIADGRGKALLQNVRVQHQRYGKLVEEENKDRLPNDARLAEAITKTPTVLGAILTDGGRTVDFPLKYGIATAGDRWPGEESAGAKPGDRPWALAARRDEPRQCSTAMTVCPPRTASPT